MALASQLVVAAAFAELPFAAVAPAVELSSAWAALKLPRLAVAVDVLEFVADDCAVLPPAAFDNAIDESKATESASDPFEALALASLIPVLPPGTLAVHDEPSLLMSVTTPLLELQDADFASALG